MIMGSGRGCQLLPIQSDPWALTAAPGAGRVDRQKPTGEKAGRLLRQRDQMVREVKSAAHSVSATLSVTWAMVLMPVWPTGVRRVRTAPPPNQRSE
ncbi:hypothetical protein MHYP_G00139930 [Metynnis hypsauchen]